MLSSDQFWEQHNRPFLDAGIGRGDTFIIVSKFTEENIFKDKANNGLTLFGWEVEYLLDRGYVYDEATRRMIRKTQ